MPIPGKGDCCFYAIVVSLLCPVTLDASEFDARLQRLLQLPLPLGPDLLSGGLPLAAPPIPVFRSTGVVGERTLRQFLHEYLLLRMEVNRVTSLWLTLGSDPLMDNQYLEHAKPNPRYAAVVKYLEDIVFYLRQLLTLYRRSRPEMAFSLNEVGPIVDNRVEVERLYSVMCEKGTYVSLESVGFLGSMFGLAINVRWWASSGLADEFRQQLTPLDSWTEAHAALGREVLSIKIYFVSFSRDVNGHPDHFEGIIDVVPRPLQSQPVLVAQSISGSSLQSGTTSSAARASVSGPPATVSDLDRLLNSYNAITASESSSETHNRAQSSTTAAYQPALPQRTFNAGASASAPTRRREPSNARSFSAQELDKLTALAREGVDNTVQFRSRWIEVAAQFAKASPYACTPEQVQRWLKKHAKKIRQSAATDTSASLNSRRSFTPSEVSALTDAVLGGMTERAQCSHQLTEIASTFSQRSPCSVAQLKTWMRNHNKAKLLRGQTQSDPPVPTAAAAAAIVPPSQTSDSASADRTARRFSDSELALLEEAYTQRGLSNDRRFDPALSDLARYFTSTSQTECGSGHIRLWLVRRKKKDSATSFGAASPHMYPTLQDVGIAITPASVTHRRKFSHAEVHRLRLALASGVTGSVQNAATFHQLAEEFSSTGIPCSERSIQAWFQTNANTGSLTASPRPRSLQVRLFNSTDVGLLREAQAAGITHHSRHHNEIRALASRLESLPGSAPCPLISLVRWFEENRLLPSDSASESGSNAPPNHGLDPPQDSLISGPVLRIQPRGAIKRRFTVAEVAYLRLARDRGVDHRAHHSASFSFIAEQFSKSSAVTASQVTQWFRNHQGLTDLKQALGLTSDSQQEDSSESPDALNLQQFAAAVELPPFVETALPQHAARVAGSNWRASKQTAPFSHSATIDAALDHFWDTSGLWRYHDFRLRLAAGELPTAEERKAALAAEMHPPVSDDVRTRCISEYNQYMDPRTPLLLCASCGVYEFNSVLLPLEQRPDGEKTLHLALPICINEVLYHTSIRMTDEQVVEHLNRRPLYRDCYSVMRVRDHSSVIDARNAARAASGLPVLDSDDDPDLNYSYYHLNSDLTFVAGDGRIMCRLCTMCDGQLKENAKLQDQAQSIPPSMSIAAGCDFGRPSALNLPELSLLEVQLIACYRVFANLVKLIAPYGLDKSSRQTAFQGHTIVFPHDGPAVCAKKLPNMEGIHDSVSILFIGTKAQWTAPSTRPTLMQKFKNIFQVRKSAVQLWLRALKRVGNPLYQAIELAPDDDPCWSEMERLADECLNRTKIADDAVTLSIEQHAASDVARARSSVNDQVSTLQSATDSEASSKSASTTPSGAAAVAADPQATTSSVFVSSSIPLPIGVLDRSGPHFGKTAAAHDQAAAPQIPSASDSAAASVAPDIRGRWQLLHTLREAIQGPTAGDVHSHAESQGATAASVSAAELTVPRGSTDPAQPAVVPASARPEVLTVPMTSTTPLNEYAENDILLLGSFPNLFFLGKKLPMSGPVSQRFRHKLLRQHDQRFSRNHQLLFLLFNQMQRHTVARNVAARVKSSPGSIEAFHEMVNEPGFTRDLDAAIKDPEGPIAEKLSRRVLPIIHVTGATVPFSATERRQALPKLIAYTHQFGMPSLFLTISPSDLDQPLTVRLASPGLSKDPDKSQRVFDFPMPALSERGRILGENPVAAAEVFHRLMDTVLKTMVGLLPIRTSGPQNGAQARPPGLLSDREQRVLGVVSTHFFVTEAQGRGTLHTHGIIWSDLPPNLLEDIAEHPELVKLIGAAIDEVCTAALPQEVHDADDERRRNNQPAERAGLSLSVTPAYPMPSMVLSEAQRNLLETLPSVKPVGLYCSFSPDSLDSSTPFKSRWQKIAAVVQRHVKHMLTCRKGTSGKYGCRMSIPQALRREPTGPSQLEDHYDAKGKMHLEASSDISPKQHSNAAVDSSSGGSPAGGFERSEDDVLPRRDSRVILWELHRPLEADGRVVTFNKTLTAALGCNTALYQLGSAQQANATLFYLLKYVTKDSTALTLSLSALHEAKRHIVQYPSVAADSGQPTRTAQHLLNRLLNNISGKSEVSAEMASAALLGMPSTFESHDTNFCFIWPAIAAVKAVRKKRESDDQERDGPDDSSDDTDSESDSSDEQASPRPEDDDADSDHELADSHGHSNSTVLMDGNALSDSTSSTDSTMVKSEADSNLRHLSERQDVDEDLQHRTNVETAEETIPIRRFGQSLVVVPQYLHYHFRGSGLKGLCFWEWVAMIRIEPMPTGRRTSTAGGDREPESKTDPPRRTSPNLGLTFDLDEAHPLSKTHVQRVRSVQAVPMLAGRTAPPYPGLVPVRKHGVGSAAHRLAAQKYAEYMLTLFVPWQLPLAAAAGSDPSIILGPDLPLVYASFRDCFSTMYHSAERTLVCRAECIVNISHGLRTSYRHKKMLTMWRNRAVLRWGAKGVEAPPGAPGSRLDPDRDLRYDDSDDREIEENARNEQIIEHLRSLARADIQAQLDADAAQLKEQNIRSLQTQYESTLSQLYLSKEEVAQHRGRASTQIAGHEPHAGHVELEMVASDDVDADMQFDDGGLQGPIESIQLHQAEVIDKVLERLRNDAQEHDDSSDMKEEADGAPSFEQLPTGHWGLDDVNYNDGGLARELDIDLDDIDIDMQAPVDPSESDSGILRLNLQQRSALQQCLTWLRETHAYMQDPAHTAAPKPLRLLIHGGAGVGKSTFARALVMKAVLAAREGEEPKQTVVCAAPTGIAATLLINGRTLHSLLGIQPWQGHGGPSASVSQRLAPLPRATAEGRFHNRHILLIDEVSMVGSGFLGAIDRRLRDIKGVDLPFGGMGVVLMGDFFQLQAVGDTSLPKAALTCHDTSFTADRMKRAVTLVNSGGQLFREFRMYRFTQQMRVRQDDPQHTALIESFQRVDKEQSPLNDDFIRHLETKYLTPQEVRLDHSWMDATIIVPSNQQRHFLLPHLVSHFALRHGKPIIRWRYQIPHASRLEQEHVEALYRLFPELTGYFVQGAPVFMTSNLNPNKGMANGTAATLHSLSWDSVSHVAEMTLKVQNAAPGEIIDLEVLPLSVNVEIAANQLLDETQRGRRRATDETLVPGRIVIPLACDSEFTLRIGKDVPVIHPKEFPYELAFAITFHKCQGRTMNKIVLDLNQQHGSGRHASVTYSSLYVGLSRVRKGSDIRLFPVVAALPQLTGNARLLQTRASSSRNASSSTPLDYLLGLHPSAEFLTWLSGFNAEGEWAESRVMVSDKERRAKASATARVQRQALLSVGREAPPTSSGSGPSNLNARLLGLEGNHRRGRNDWSQSHDLEHMSEEDAERLQSGFANARLLGYSRSQAPMNPRLLVHVADTVHRRSVQLTPMKRLRSPDRQGQDSSQRRMFDTEEDAESLRGGFENARLLCRSG